MSNLTSMTSMQDGVSRSEGHCAGRGIFSVVRVIQTLFVSMDMMSLCIERYSVSEL